MIITGFVLAVVFLVVCLFGINFRKRKHNERIGDK